MPKKIIHPLFGEADVRDGPSVLDDEMSVRPDKPIPPAFQSPLIESEPPIEAEPLIELDPFIEPEPPPYTPITFRSDSIPKRVKRRLINLARKVLDKLDE